MNIVKEKTLEESLAEYYDDVQEIMIGVYVGFTEIRLGKHLGEQYRVVAPEKMIDFLEALALAFYDNGISLERIRSPQMGVRVANQIWKEDYIRTMRPEAIRAAKIRVGIKWREATGVIKTQRLNKIKPSVSATV